MTIGHTVEAEPRPSSSQVVELTATADTRVVAGNRGPPWLRPDRLIDGLLPAEQTPGHARDVENAGPAPPSPIDALHGAFGQAIARRRSHLHITKAELAGRAKLNRNYVAQLEAGRRTPTLSTILRLANALEMTPTRLVGAAKGNPPRVRVGASQPQIDEFHAALGAVVTRWRKYWGLTKTDLSKKALSRNYVAQVEEGARSPTLDALADLADAFDIEPRRLILAAQRRVRSLSIGDLSALSVTTTDERRARLRAAASRRLATRRSGASQRTS